MTTVNIDLSVQQPLVELDVAAGQAVLVPKLSAPDLSKMEELVAAAADSETAAGEHAQAAQNSATTASESATTAGEHEQEAKNYASAAGEHAITAGGHAVAAQGSAATANEKAQAAQVSAATASESASNAGEHAVAAGQQAQAAQNSATTASGHAQAASESAATTGQHAATASAQAQAAQGSAATASEKAQSARESATTAGLALTSMQGMVDAADNSAKAAKLAESAVNESALNIEILTLATQAAAGAAQESALKSQTEAEAADESAEEARAEAQAAKAAAETSQSAIIESQAHASTAQTAAENAEQWASDAKNASESSLASATTAEAAKSESQQAAAAAAGSAVNAKASETAALAASQAAQVSAVTVNEAVAVVGGHASAAQASATTAQASAQAAAKSLADMALLGGGNDDLYAKMRLYTQSRLGLIANGSGGMGDNYNFSTMTYTQKDVYFGRGAFISGTLGGIHTTDEKIPLEPDSNYEFSVYARCLEKGDATSTAAGINLARCFDVDGLDILPQHVGTITVKLGAPLKNGDTTVTIHPDDRERMRVWVAANKNGGHVHLANPNYVNSKGYRYERGTYVREIYNTGEPTPDASLLYDVNNGVLSKFTINAAPEAGVASGESITFTKTGAVYVYAIGNMNNSAIPTDRWERYSGRFSTNSLRPGTAEVVIGCQLNRSSRYGTKTALSAMSLHKVF